ncbi:hypothetical protein [Polyangium sp. 15x6]|uniref:hypothetical protein n=1 Tax=Polyangium sp. 15x6 TaxID=3042687 RepID=UPI00249A7C13|nr:hypothetical protein [Polyangium sp. 15x6]MDI3284792.1 hypothetical protein [Polyangium sp. 15x6]
MDQNNGLLGKWTYRSFKNDPSPVGDDGQKALALFFAEGTITIERVDHEVVKATLSWGGQVQMYLSGRLYAGQGLAPTTLVMTGIGIDNSPTQGWVYQYHGYVVPSWPGGVDQVPALVGSVTRTVRHGSGQAGYVASFLMVKQPL